MTDARVSQLANVAVVSGEGGDVHLHQLAAVQVCIETPPVAGGAQVRQIAFVMVDIEFVIPPIFIPINCGNFMATMPYYIGEF